MVDTCSSSLDQLNRCLHAHYTLQHFWFHYFCEIKQVIHALNVHKWMINAALLLSMDIGSGRQSLTLQYTFQLFEKNEGT